MVGNQANQPFGLVTIELIQDKGPVGLRVGGDGLGDVRDKIGFGAGWPE
jgi:hypothetical protein